MASAPPILRTVDEISPAWLQEALGTDAITGVSVEQIGTGQMSRNYRVGVDYGVEDGGGPESVVVKLASPDETSRTTGVGLGVYEREIRFYRELAPRLSGPLAGCHLALFDADGGWFTLVLEDAAPSVQGDQVAGCSIDQARL